MNKHHKLVLALIGLLFTGTIWAKSLPQAELTDFKSGAAVNTSELQGKVIYLDFWASWCKPCKKSFPFMNEITEKYDADKFQVVAINMDEFRKDAEKFLQEVPANFTIYQDNTKELAKNLDLPGLPVAFIVNANGEVVARHIGFNDRKKQKKLQQLDYLLGQP